MSHGVYSSALDLWSMGCVFGELLQRVPYLGKAATPHLQARVLIWQGGSWGGGVLFGHESWHLVAH